MRIGYESWQAAGWPENGWNASVIQSLSIFKVITGVITILLLTICYVIVFNRFSLEVIVDKRTTELREEILERKSVEKALVEREEQYWAVVDNIGDYIMRYDKNFRHTYANRNALEVTGLPEDQYIGKTHREMGLIDAYDYLTPSVTPTGNENILFVDDEKSIVKLGVRLLQRLGYNVTGKTSSKEAIELFSSTPDDFDLVITDMTMPLFLGTDLAEKILEVRQDIPILLCTGFSERVNKETAQSFGIKGYINKPILLKELATKVRELLDQYKE